MIIFWKLKNLLVNMYLMMKSNMDAPVKDLTLDLFKEWINQNEELLLIKSYTNFETCVDLCNYLLKYSSGDIETFLEMTKQEFYLGSFRSDVYEIFVETIKMRVLIEFAKTIKY
jgi:hypothetical protein